MKIHIAPKLFSGFLVIILLNSSYVVIVSRLTVLNVLTTILKRQNEVKNHLLRISNMHTNQTRSRLIYDKMGKSEYAQSFRETGAMGSRLIDTVLIDLHTVARLDSLVQSADSTGMSLLPLINVFTDQVKANHAAFTATFDTIVAQNAQGVYSAGDRRRILFNQTLDSTDQKIREGLAATDSLVEIHTQARIKEIESRVDSMRRLTLVIVIGISIFSMAFGLFFSRAITNSLRRLREATRNIGKGDFDFSPRGYPRDEIGELATAFFEMAYDLKRTQEELIKSKRLAAIGEVVASVNHEINNPLMIISGNAQFLEMSMEGYPAEMKERVRAILEETDRISRVTRKLREIKNPVVEDYTSSGEQMINIDKSST